MRHMTVPRDGQYDPNSNTVFDSAVGQWVPLDEFYRQRSIPTYTDADTRMNPWKVFGIVAAVIAALLVAIFITVAVSGSSDDPDAMMYSTTEQAYLNAIHDLDLTHTSGDAGFLADGELICNALAQGYSEYTVAGEMQQNSVDNQGRGGISRSQAASIVDVTNRILCSATA